ncbi:MAG TPA: vWA domain-containing protein, partial [Ktedonobacterales bacterium]
MRPRHSWRALSALVLAVAGLVAMTLTTTLAVASPARAAGLHPHATSATPSKHSTILVLDMSGSMGANDPDGLRCSAANAYIDLSGPGDYIGVVGLTDPNGAHGGPHDFPTTVDWGLAPKEMATVKARESLRAAIAQKSNNCRPNGATPTYDSLAKAERMLEAATQGGKIGGSVILLTDGAPDPSTDDQLKAIRSELVPQFKSHGWPVDTIALGADQSFHGFLSDLSSATSGSFYDDGHGIVPGVSPLNITPFFLNIFRVRNGRSPGPDIPPTQLDGGTTARNFSVGQYVTHLDIVVVKDSPDAQVSIAAPNGQRFPPAAAGTFVSTDPHYAIFSIDNPQQGAWEVDVQGSGLFLMDSLKVSALALNITAPNPTVPLALGEPFTITAQLSNQGSSISGGQFAVRGKLTYTGGENGKSRTQDVLLNDASGSGSYTAKVTVPTDAPAGSYQLAISARAASEDVLTAQIVVRLALFPSAQLISPENGQATTKSVTASVVGFDGVLRAI